MALLPNDVCIRPCFWQEMTPGESFFSRMRKSKSQEFCNVIFLASNDYRGDLIHIETTLHRKVDTRSDTQSKGGQEGASIHLGPDSRDVWHSYLITA